LHTKYGAAVMLVWAASAEAIPAPISAPRRSIDQTPHTASKRKKISSGSLW